MNNRNWAPLRRQTREEKERERERARYRYPRTSMSRGGN